MKKTILLLITLFALIVMALSTATICYAEETEEPTIEQATEQLDIVEKRVEKSILILEK